MNIAMLGTGLMGAAMARSLLRAGHDVSVWNRSPDKAQALADDGARVAADLAAAVTGAEVVVTMLYDPDSVVEVMSEAADHVGPETVWLQTSTVGQDAGDRFSTLATERGLHYVDAPVLGTRQPAEDGTLVVLAAGPASLRPRVQPVLDAIGSRTAWVSERPGDGSRLKLVANAWVATMTASLAQSVGLARNLGLDPQLFLTAIAGGPLDTPYAQLKGGAMIEDEFPLQFALDGVRKDLGLIRAAAADSGTPTGLLDAVLVVFDRASDRGFGAEDMAAAVAAFTAIDPTD